MTHYYMTSGYSLPINVEHYSE